MSLSLMTRVHNDAFPRKEEEELDRKEMEESKIVFAPWQQFHDPPPLSYKHTCPISIITEEQEKKRKNFHQFLYLYTTVDYFFF